MSTNQTVSITLEQQQAFDAVLSDMEKLIKEEFGSLKSANIIAHKHHLGYWNQIIKNYFHARKVTAPKPVLNPGDVV